MYKYLTSVLLMCIVGTECLAGAGGHLYGGIDDRSYADMSNPAYSWLARMTLGCSGGFIAPNLILTNLHCYEACTARGNCSFKYWNGKEYVVSRATKVKRSTDPKNEPDYSKIGKDWAIFEIDGTNPSYKPVAAQTTPGAALRGGFGQMRIIPDNEIPIVKEVYIKVYNNCEKTVTKEERQKNPEAVLHCVYKDSAVELQKKGLKPLFGDGENLKVQSCNIQNPTTEGGRRNMWVTTCDSAGGDSGAPLLRGSHIVGLNNSGIQVVFVSKDDHGAWALDTSNFYTGVQKLISNQNSGTQNPEPPTDPNGGDDKLKPLTQEQMDELLKQRLEDFQCD